MFGPLDVNSLLLSKVEADPHTPLDIRAIQGHCTEPQVNPLFLSLVIRGRSDVRKQNSSSRKVSEDCDENYHALRRFFVISLEHDWGVVC